MYRSVDFYTRILGMKVLRTLKHKEDKYQLTFLGYDSESTSCALELTYNNGISQYDMGTAYGHIAISVDNCQKSCENIEAMYGKITKKPFPLQGSNEIIAFVSDPDGYQIELVQREH